MIIGSDRVVESGNGRTIALGVAKMDFPQKWENYQTDLQSRIRGYGISLEALKSVQSPVLVRERTTQVDRVQFAASANQAATLAMSPLEQALQDSQRISDQTVANLVITETQSIDQALMASVNKPLVTAFFKELPENEQAALAGAHGELNIQGLQRIKAALFAKVYPGEAGQRLTQAFFESLDPTVKTIENALFDSLPQMAKAESLIRSEQRRQDLSLANDISQTIDLFARLKQQNISVEHYLRQSSFATRDLTTEQEQLLAYFDAAGRSRKLVREFLRDYAAAVIQSPPPQQVAMLSMEAESLKDMVHRLTTERIKEAKGEDAGLFGLTAERERAGFRYTQEPIAEPAIAERPQLEKPRGRKPPTERVKPSVATPKPEAEKERLKDRRLTIQTPAGVKMDSRRLARTVVPAVPKTDQEQRLQARWERHPNRLDKAGVDVPAAAVRPAAVKEPWQMTHRDFYPLASSIGKGDMVPWERRYGLSKGAIRAEAAAQPETRLHKAIVRQALVEGKPVPLDVLEDYPDLSARYALKVQPSGVKEKGLKSRTPFRR